MKHLIVVQSELTKETYIVRTENEPLLQIFRALENKHPLKVIMDTEPTFVEIEDGESEAEEEEDRPEEGAGPQGEFAVYGGEPAVVTGKVSCLSECYNVCDPKGDGVTTHVDPSELKKATVVRARIRARSRNSVYGPSESRENQIITFKKAGPYVWRAEDTGSPYHVQDLELVEVLDWKDW